MAQVNLGSIKFRWKGTYNGATSYTADDVVEYNGSSYICILASTGNLPTNATYFEQMSQAGTNGTDGTDLTTTLTTQGDIVYRDGSGLARLGAGTAGQALITNGTGANPSWGDVTASGLITNVSVVSNSGNYNHTNSGFTNFGSGLSYTPQTTTSRVMAFAVATVTSEQDGTDNDNRTRIKFGTDNSSGTTIYENSETESNIGHVNMLAAGHGIFADINAVISSCQRNSSNNVVLKIGSVSNLDPGTTIYCSHQQAVFMEIE